MSPENRTAFFAGTPLLSPETQSAPFDVLIQAGQVVTEYELYLQDQELQEQRLRGLVHEQIEKLLADPQIKPLVLPGTGWDMEGQLQVWAKDFFQGCLEGESFPETRERSLKKTGEDFWGFYWEYLKRLSLLPIYANFKKIDGQRRVIAYRYGDRPYEEIVGPVEREGAVKETVEEIVTILPNLPSGSMVVMTSPPGWSNLGADHPCSQTYVYKVNQNDLEALTIRSGMDLAESEEFLAILKGEEQDSFQSALLSKKERIKKTVKNLVILDGNEGDHDFSEVIEAIREVRRGKPLLIDEEIGLDGQVAKREMRTFDQLYKQLESKDNLSLLEKRIGLIINRFEVWAKEKMNDLSADSLRQLALAIGETIYRMDQAIEQFETEKDEEQRAYLVYAPFLDFGQKEVEERLERIQAVGGCSGGGREGISPLLGIEPKTKTVNGELYIECCGGYYKKGTICPTCGKKI